MAQCVCNHPYSGVGGVVGERGAVGMVAGRLAIAEWVQSISIPLFDEVMRGVSGVGWWLPASIITVCAGLALVVLRQRSDAALLVVLVSVSSGMNWVVKQIVASPRPDSAMLEVREELTSYGFPSGHVLFAVVCFGALAILLSGVGGRYAGLRKAMQAGLVMLVVAMATSRVYLGVHWPSDVGGFSYGGSVFGGTGVVSGAVAGGWGCDKISAIPV